PGVGLAVARGEPAEARQEPAAPPLAEQGQRRQRDEPRGGADRREPPRREPADEPDEQRQHADQGARDRGRERRRELAELVDTDVGPVRAEAERAEPVQRAEPERPSGRGVAPQPEQERPRQRRDPELRERRERERQNRPGAERGKRAHASIAGMPPAQSRSGIRRPRSAQGG